MTEDGRHEGYVARVFADGALGAGVAPEGVIVFQLGDVVLGREDWQHRPASEVVGFVAACECGWQGLPWTRVVSLDREDPTARRLYATDDQVLYPDDTVIGRFARLEWEKHTAPDEALVEVTVLAAEQAAVGRRLDAAVARARAAGASWDRIGTAAGGITRQSAHERWRHVTAGDPAGAGGQAP